MKNFCMRFLMVSIAAFAFTTVAAQTQKTAVQKTGATPENVTHQPSHEQNATVAPGETNAPAQNDALTDGPVLNDAVINVKDERQYMEQKKKEQEKKKSENKTDTPK